MKIGIAKLGKKVFFNDTSSDFASWSDEVVKVYRIFEKFGHEVHMVTETDLDQTASRPERYDRIYVFAGIAPLSALEGLKDLCLDLRLIITDLRLMPLDLSMFSTVYSQSPLNHVNHKRYKFLPPTFVFYNHEIKDYNKDILIYFGGGMRNRKADFLEYVYRPNVEMRSKITLLGYESDNRVGRNQHIELLKRSKYSPVIADVDYNEIGFITMRHYENMMYDVLSLVDSKYDKTGALDYASTFLRVSNFEEMMLKIYALESEFTLKKQMIESQRLHILDEYITGKHCYDILID